MKNQGLILGFAAALLGAAFILAGCEQETKTEYVNVPVPGAYQPPDNAVTALTLPELQVLLADTSGLYDHIIYAAAPTDDIEVPAVKTLYLKAAGSGVTLTNGVALDGTLVVYGGDDFTPGANLGGDGTLDVEEGTLEVDAETLFKGDDKLGGVKIKKGAWLKNTSTTALADDDDLAAWVGYAGEGSLEIETAITAVSLQDAITAIGAPPAGQEVVLTVNPTTTPTETSISVPAGVKLTTNKDLASVTSLTVNGTLNATGATLATAGASITLGSKSSTKLGTVAKLAADVTVPAGAFFGITGGITNLDSKTVTFKKGGANSIISDIDLTFSDYKVESNTAKVTLADSITLAEDQKIFISFPSGSGITGLNITVPAGKKITNAGTITLSPGVSLVLATTSAISVAGIGGAGKIVAGKTTITGAWDAVTATEAAGTLTITSATTGATITADGTAATGLKAGASGGTITQADGSGNALAIGEDTEIALGGDGTALGKIVLKGAASNPGELTFTNSGSSDVGSSIVTTAVTSTNKIENVTKIGGNSGVGTAIVGYFDNATIGSATKFSKLGASNATNGIKGGSADNDTELSGKAYTVADFGT
jgi:hypothetical protein